MNLFVEIFECKCFILNLKCKFYIQAKINSKLSTSLKSILSVFLIFILYGCQFNGSLKGLISYRTEIEEPGLKNKISYVFYCEGNLAKQSQIVITNGKEVKRCIARYSKVLMYLWKPNCQSDYCLDLELLQSYCDKINYELFIVAEYYDQTRMNKAYLINRPIIGIDTYYYESDFTKKYVSRFMKDLVDTAFSYKGSLFYLFNHNEFKGEFHRLDEMVLPKIMSSE